MFPTKIAALAIVFCFSFATRPVRAETALEARLAQEARWIANGIPIIPHRANYILPLTHNFDPNDAPYEAVGEPTLKKTEVKFQISFKVPLWERIFQHQSGLYFAYTQLSLWQLYNQKVSSPLRESNYEPEVYFQFDTRERVGPFNNRLVLFGAAHQSNGRLGPVSRSWNRVYAQAIMESGDFILSVKPWYRLPESSKDDNNPDIHRYMGYGDIRLSYRWGVNFFSCLVRNNLNFNHNKGALEFDWSFPLSKLLKGYVQYFNGYGESLLDYNHHNQRVGIGIALSD